jgi:hypothetical protein
VGTQSDIRDQRYRTEPDIGSSDIELKSAESDIISDIGIKFSPISDIQYLQILVAQWYVARDLSCRLWARNQRGKLCVIFFYLGH